MKIKLLNLKIKNQISLYFFLITLVVSFQTHAQDFSNETKKVASDRGILDSFGTSVAVDGDYAIVSAKGYDDHTTPVNNIGVVYFYKKGTNGVWEETQLLTASDYHADDYARSVSISGNYAVLGVQSHDYDENNANLMSSAGAIFIFERDASGNWSEIKKMVSNERASGDYFGASVSMSGDYLAVGSYGHDPLNTSGNATISNAGAVFMVVRQQSNGEWVQVQKIVSNDRAENDYFGNSVAVYGLSTGLGNTLVVGAYREDENIVGSTTRTDAGSAYIFNQPSIWTQTQKITATDRNNDDWFGFSVSIYQNKILIGAPQEDQPASGSGAILNSGSAYVFEKSGTWSQTQKIVASNRDIENKFGYAVAIYNDLALIGTNVPVSEEGQAYLFQKTSNWSQVENLTASDGVANNTYGSAIALNNETIFIGALSESLDADGANSMYSAGAIYIYQDPDEILGINENVYALEFSIYNTDNALTIVNTTQEKVTDANVYSIGGQLVKNYTINNNTLTNEINISALSSGIYIISIHTDKGIFSSKKFVKK